MSLLSDDDIAEAAQRREVFRERSVSTRLTRKETRNLDALAKSRGVQRGELIRQELFSRSTPPRSFRSPRLPEVHRLGRHQSLQSR
jgi:hypothetical protein